MDNIDLTNLTFDKTTIISYLQKLIDAFNDFDGIVGDVPVSEQLGIALSHMATKDHNHDEYALSTEVEALRNDVDRLIDLVGDISVSEQITESIDRIKENILLK
ncbi:MAG: hypothetical protein ACI4XN_12515 [Candidatus Kurthia intestinigallinarum]